MYTLRYIYTPLHTHIIGGVLKDLDLVKDGELLHLGKKRERFLAQLEKDAGFLASLNIMARLCI